MNNLQRKVNWPLGEKYFGKPSSYFKKDVERLKKGEPLDYVIGYIEFLGCRIDLSKKPFIPRPETEFWVEKAIEDLRFKNYNLRILDMFAGSGCIGIAILKHIKNAHIVFAEKDIKAVEQIKINLKINQPSLKTSAWQSKIIKSDVFSNVIYKFSYIFANPPYISQKRRNKIQKSVLKYEPKTALFGGQDGLFYVRKFLASAKNFLNPNGKIYMEFDSIQRKKIDKLLKKYNYKKWTFHKDQNGKWRYCIVKI